MRIFTCILFTILLNNKFIFSQTNDLKIDQSKSIDSLTKDIDQQKGMITSYFKKDKLLFEIDKNILEKDLLMVTRFIQFPANYQPYQNAGSKTSEQLIHFIKKGDRILLLEKSYINVANIKDPISLSVKQNNFPPILAAFEIKNIEPDRFLIDVSNYFNADSPGFNIIGSSQKKEFGIGGADTKRSFIDGVKSFPENIEIKHTLTYKSNKPPRGNNSKTLSFQVNHSIILLPENQMAVRYLDERIGWFNLKKINYSSKALKSDEVRIIKRWRLEPKDKEAYFKGELVEPIKPIVYYIDPATPNKWKPYFKKGIEDWARVFEKAGFKNAIIAKDTPSKEENPNFSLEDVRYSSVRYVATTTRNATGPSVADPRSGEIIESDIIWYHNHFRTYRNRYLLETAAANPLARTLETPKEEIGKMVRRVISHEIGHALGLPHNMKASSAYPVDSLRSGRFTKKMGIATTIMDYARYNYVAQPGDKDINFIRQLGPYDDYAIEWGYRYFDKETLETEKVFLKSFIDEKSMNRMYMFGSGGNDPDTQTENIGDDPVKASSYGLKNLKIVANNLDDWTTDKGDNYNDLNELYGEMIYVYRRYINHVIAIIGGVNETLMVKGQNNIPYKNVSVKNQKRALYFLNIHLWRTQNWLMNPELISKIKEKGVLKRIQNIQRSALNRILSVSRLNRMLSTYLTLNNKGFDPVELIDSLYDSFFEKLDINDQNILALQIRFAEKIKSLCFEDELNPIIVAKLISLNERINKTSKKRINKGDERHKNHFKYLAKITKKIYEIKL